MQKILMIQLSHNIGAKTYKPDAYPLGLGYLSNSLKNNGYEVDFLDLWAHPEEKDRYISILNTFDAVGISFYVTQYRQLASLLDEIKKIKPEIPVIVGGPGAKPSCKIILSNLPVDFVVLEEGEITLVNLLNEIFSNKDYNTVKGIAFTNNENSVILTPPQPYIKNLDELGFPDRDCLDFELYSRKVEFGMYPKWKGKKITNVITGRGCPYNCTYCSKTFSGCRLRSIENVLSEIKFLVEEKGIQGIQFNDELVVMSKKRIFELCDGLKQIGVEWGCQGRVNLVNDEILRKMKECGCVYVGLGFESASQKILDIMKKKISADMLVDAYKATKKVKLIPVVQYMFGFIGENDETLERTIQFFKEIDHPGIGFNTQAIPGTELYDYCVEKGLIKDEKKYLENFDEGYNRDDCSINFSEFPDLATLNEKIEKTRYQIKINYYKRHPFAALKWIIELIGEYKFGIFKKIFNRLCMQ